MNITLYDLYGMNDGNKAYFRKLGTACFDFVGSKEHATDLTPEEAAAVLKGKEYYCKLYNAAGMRAECTRTWKVYGAEGHRQRESFCDSYTYDFSEDGNTRIIEVMNADRTGTNDYTIIRITRSTPEECAEELEGQITDGIFENSRTGAVIEITE